MKKKDSTFFGAHCHWGLVFWSTLSRRTKQCTIYSSAKHPAKCIYLINASCTRHAHQVCTCRSSSVYVSVWGALLNCTNSTWFCLVTSHASPGLELLMFAIRIWRCIDHLHLLFMHPWLNHVCRSVLAVVLTYRSVRQLRGCQSSQIIPASLQVPQTKCLGTSARAYL
jgi:hypothetical protein